jgi:hypothetical protein
MTLKLTTSVLFVMLVALNLYGPASADSHNKRDVSIRQPLLGGYKPAMVDAADVKRMAAFATSAISASDSGPAVQLIRIRRAWKQVVSGTNYKLILELLNTSTGQVLLCEVIVFDQPWTNTLELRSFRFFSKRERRQIPGGYVVRNVNDPDVKEMAAFASSILTANSHPHLLALIKILKAESQVVAGTNYKMALLFANRPQHHSRYLLLCDVIVFDQPWTHTRKLTEYKCRRVRSSAVSHKE